MGRSCGDGCIRVIVTGGIATPFTQWHKRGILGDGEYDETVIGHIGIHGSIAIICSQTVVERHTHFTTNLKWRSHYPILSTGTPDIHLDVLRAVHTMVTIQTPATGRRRQCKGGRVIIQTSIAIPAKKLVDIGNSVEALIPRHVSYWLARHGKAERCACKTGVTVTVAVHTSAVRHAAHKVLKVISIPIHRNCGVYRGIQHNYVFATTTGNHVECGGIALECSRDTFGRHTCGHLYDGYLVKEPIITCRIHVVAESDAGACRSICKGHVKNLRHNRTCGVKARHRVSAQSHEGGAVRDVGDIANTDGAGGGAFRGSLESHIETANRVFKVRQYKNVGLSATIGVETHRVASEARTCSDIYIAATDVFEAFDISSRRCCAQAIGVKEPRQLADSFAECGKGEEVGPLRRILAAIGLQANEICLVRQKLCQADAIGCHLLAHSIGGSGRVEAYRIIFDIKGREGTSRGPLQSGSVCADRCQMQILRQQASRSQINSNVINIH